MKNLGKWTIPTHLTPAHFGPVNILIRTYQAQIRLELKDADNCFMHPIDFQKLQLCLY